jgi:hypothetical protein
MSLKCEKNFDGGLNGSHCCIVIEGLGPNPRRMKRLHEDGLLPLTMAWKAARKITESEEYLHSQGIVHGRA